MNHERLMEMTDEAEVKVYLRQVKQAYGKAGLLQVASGLMDYSDKINQRTLWALQVCQEQE